MPPIGEDPYDPKRTGSWLICTACGTQFPTADRQKRTTCKICDDPRQFTPPTGQAFTTLDEIRSYAKNTFTPFPCDDRFISIVTEPKVAIGQRAILIKHPKGNVLWDCITLIDDETIEKIKAMGGLKAIMISHPHYYTTNVEWARAFDCPVYITWQDKQWRTQHSEYHNVFHQIESDLLIDYEPSDIKVLQLGGHFAGSCVLLYDGRLLIADTLVTTPAGLGSWDTDALGNARIEPGGAGNSYAFMYSIPNMLPLSASTMQKMWDILKKYEFRSTHGAFLNTDIVKTAPEMKRRVLDSMQLQAHSMESGDYPFRHENLD
ncbi:beta-lactamase-like protein [Hypoxylon rubiginosum]|uniref:Beta-lactamase-like protein n=1 Tax=Hypoxylon rubiginosum TaxID=110542 RepID=A0ACC0CWU6_9PEZI|nr:beta-lactamase-like protein [Hypoxylon rubiginosum]